MKIYSNIGLFIVLILFSACSEKDNSTESKTNNIIWTTKDSSYHEVTVYQEQ